MRVELLLHAEPARLQAVVIGRSRDGKGGVMRPSAGVWHLGPWGGAEARGLALHQVVSTKRMLRCACVHRWLGVCTRTGWYASAWLVKWLGW